MRTSRKSIVIGVIVALALMIFVIVEREYFFVNPVGGAFLFALFLLLSALAGVAAAILPDRESPAFRPRLYKGWLLFVFAVAPLWMIAVVERLNGNFLWDLYGPDYLVDNYLIAIIVYLLIFAVSGSVRITVLITSPLFFLFGLANMYVKEFKGSPLLPMDAGSIATAAKVAGSYEYSIGFDVTFAVVLTVLLMAMACHLFMPERTKRLKIAIRLAALMVVLVSGGLFYGTELPVKLGMRPDFFNQTRGYENRGAVREFANNSRYIWHRAPDGYDPEELETIALETIDAEDGATILGTLLSQNKNDTESNSAAASADGKTTPEAAGADSNSDAAGANSNSEAAGADSNSDAAGAGAEANAETAADAVPATLTDSAKYPDIIIVMNESFSDLTYVKDFETDQEVMPNFTALKEQGISGNVFVSVRGTGTSNTEYELLTGNSMAFLPAGSNAYQLYLKDGQPGLVSDLKSLGYKCDASHPYFSANWNRPKVYDYMEFDSYTAMEDMFPEGYGGEYLKNGEDRYHFIKALEEDYPGQIMAVDGYISDRLGYEKLKEQYEAREKTSPYFHFHITMQNHSPYESLFGTELPLVTVTGREGLYPELERYLARIKESDRALKELTDYFAEAERPTILLFFGDHQPIVEPEFFEELTGSPMDEWTPEKTQDLYVTPFLLWANYDLPGKGTSAEAISVNYLSTLLMETAGLPKTTYRQYLAALYQKYPVITAQGCRDAEGRFFLAEDAGEDISETAGDTASGSKNSDAADSGASKNFDTAESGGSENEQRETDLLNYEQLTYNNLTDHDHLAESLFKLK